MRELVTDLSEIGRKLDEILEEFIITYSDGKYLAKIASASGPEIEVTLERDDVVSFDPNLAEFFRIYPDVFLKKFREIAEKKSDAKVHVIVRGVPEMPIRQLTSSKYIGHLVAFKGIVTKITNSRPRIAVAKFVCPSCGFELEVPDPPTKVILNPPKCPMCKTQMVFSEPDSVFEDIQLITVQERTEDLPTGATPMSIDCLLREPLIDKVYPGDSVKIIGILRYSLARKNRLFPGMLDLYVEVVGIEVGNIEDESLELTEEELETIEKYILEGRAVEVVKSAIAPGIQGYDEIKEAIAYQLFGGVNKTLPDGTTIRGNIHILLIGDPGLGKSQILRSVANLAPRAIFTTGEGSTGAGLTAAVVRTEAGFSLEAGALVLADGGIAAIDEFDKMRKEDREKLHEAMEQQSFHPETEVLLVNGERKRIGEFIDALMMMFSENVQREGDSEILELPPFVAIYLPSSTFMEAVPMRVTKVSRHKAPKKLYRVKLEPGTELIVTPEHPFVVLKGEELEVKPAAELRPGDKIPTSDYIYIYERSGTINENLARIMARFLIDGVLGERSIAIKRIPEELDKIDRNRVKETFYDAHITKDEKYIRIRSTSLMDFLHDNCEELFNRRVPAALVRESPIVIQAFLEEFFIASNGRVDDKKLAEDLQLLFARLGTATRIIEVNGKYTLQLYEERPKYREVEEVEEIDSDAEYVYDLLVEPTHVFVMPSGAIIHNSISVSKAGINARLNARTAILAAANPKYSRFIPGKPIDDQIDLPPTILSRFDLIFPLRDIAEENRDRRIAKHIIEVRANYDSIKPELPPKLLKKRIYYAKRNVRPRISLELREKIADFYVSMRKSSKEGSVPITPRQLESILRLAEARARLHLRDRVTEEDVEAAIRLVSKFITDVLGGDVDALYGMSAKEREKAIKVDEAIKAVLEEYGQLHIRELIRLVQELTGESEEKIRRHIAKLYQAGKLEEIEPGIYRLL